MSERDKNWYIANVRFIASNYNKRVNNFTKRDDPQRLSPVEEMIRMFSYYLGEQDNRDYYYTTTDEDNCELPTVWVNGQKVTSLIDFMLGKFIELIENIDPTVKTSGKAAYNRKTRLLNELLLKVESKEFFEELALMGMDFKPMGGDEMQFEDSEAVYRFMETDYRERAELIATELGHDIINRNEAKEKYKQAALYAMLGGIVGIHNRVQNGKEYFDVVLPHKLILDRSQDDDLHRKDRFVGRIDTLTPLDVLTLYGDQLTSEEIEELGKINSQNINSIFNVATNVPSVINWATTLNGIPQLTAVTVYWVSRKDIRYEQTKDKYGNVHYSRVKKKSKSGEYFTNTICKATLIGDKYLVNYGEDTNIVRSHQNPGDVELPIHVFMPNMIMGDNRSIAARLHKHQDRIDFFTNEITKMVTRAKGKVYIINKQRLGSATSKDLINDFTRMGIHVSDGVVTGEEYVPGQENRAVEVVDMTLDPNVQQLVSLRREEERLMEEIVNISKIAQGQQTGYVGAKTQAGTSALSNLTTAHLYQGFIKFVEKHLKHGLNQYKIALMSESENDIPVVGTKGVEYLKITKDFTFEQLDVYLKIRDFIDDSARERIIGIALAAAQNQMIDMIDYINIERCKTYSELINELEYSLNKKERTLKQKEAMAQMQQQALIEQQMQAQNSVEQMKEQGANYRTEVSAGAKLAAQQQPNLEM